MRKILYVLLGVLMIGCSEKTLKTKNQHDSGSSSLKIMSYNIHIANPPSKRAGYTDLPAIAQVIKKERPDLVALQEVDAYTKRSGTDSHQAKDLAKMTGMEYFFVKAMDRSGGEYGIAVLSRHPIKESKAIKLPLPLDSFGGENRAAALILIEVNKHKLVFIGTHLDHKSDANRAHQANLLLNEIKAYQKYPLFIAGDFNMAPDNKAFSVFDKEFSKGCVECPFTFSATKPWTTIDYILLNKHAQQIFNIKGYRTVDEKYASDHLPLVVDMEFQ